MQYKPVGQRIFRNKKKKENRIEELNEIFSHKWCEFDVLQPSDLFIC